jgi:tetratricopeptide (TPR) repeat protein
VNHDSFRCDSPHRFARFGLGVAASVLILLLGFSASAPAGQQKVRRDGPATQASPKQAPAPAHLELEKRRKAALSAQQVGDPEAIAEGNRRLIAFCLRQMGQLRLREAAYLQAIELYRHSLDFEDVPDTRVDLAIAELYINKLDDALAETAKVLTADPRNARAWNVQGKAWMKKQDPQRAAESLSRSIAIQPDFEAAYALAISLLAAKQKEKADIIFRQMVEQVGDSGPLRVFFARAYRDANFMDDTLSELKRAIQLETSTPHAHYFLGLSYLILNEWAPTQESRQEFLKEVEFHPSDFLSNYFLGVIASIKKQLDESDRYLTIAAKVDPSSPEAWLYLGLNAYAREDNAHAEEYLRKATVLAEGQVSEAHYLIRKGFVVLGRILVNSGRKEEGQRYLKKARELQNLALDESLQGVSAIQSEAGAGTGAAIAPFVPKQEEEVTLSAMTGPADPTAQVDAAVLAQANLTAQEKQLAAAQEKELRAILGSSFNDLATSEAVRQQYEPALGHYKEAERWDPSVPGLLHNLGTAAFRTEDYAETVRALSTELSNHPEDVQTRATLGVAYFGANDYAKAARTIAPLAEVAEHDAAVGYAWAASLTRLGDPKQATKVLVELEKSELDTHALLLVGQLWTDIGDYSRSVETLHRALQIDPALPKAHYYSGLAHLRAERPTDAVPEFEAELKLAPDDPDVRYSLGYAFLQESRRHEAVALFRSVLSAHPEHSKAQYQLGKMLLDDGNAKEAILHLEEAARLNPAADYIHYQLQAAYRKEQRLGDADRELQLYKETKARNRQLDLPKPVQEP